MEPSRAPIFEDRAKIVAADVLVCEMTNRKVELRILTFQSTLHSLAGFLRLRGIGTRRVVLDLFGVSMGGLAKTLEIFRETRAKFAHAEMEPQADSLPER